jgi:hypothetical protein
MKKVLNDPELNYSKGEFERPEKELGVELDCSKYKTPNQQKSGDGDFGI